MKIAIEEKNFIKIHNKLGNYFNIGEENKVLCKIANILNAQEWGKNDDFNKTLSYCQSKDLDTSPYIMAVLMQLKQFSESSDDSFFELTLSQNMKLLYENATVISADELKQNLYYKNIKITEKQIGNYLLYNDSFSKYDSIITNPSINVNGRHIPLWGIIDDDFEYPAIRDTTTNSVWMSITPNEINTIQSHIDMAKGSVLTLGCGLGYYAYMVSEKDDVESVTIIEYNQDVIDLFTSEILPQFKHKDKIKIIKSDAFEYVQNLEDGIFDYCFADIWIGSADIYPYLKLKEICVKFKKTVFSYWIEETFILSSITGAICKIQEDILYYMANERYDFNLVGDEKKVDDYWARLLEKTRIQTTKDIDYFLDTNNILKILTLQDAKIPKAQTNKKKKRK